MGFRLSRFSLSELQRISIPGTVTPALFWVLPIGGWDERNIERWWHYFTRASNTCADLGLLLVEHPLGWRDGSDGANPVQVNLDEVGARLDSIMPRGSDRFGDDGTWADNTRRLILFSGAYPQPGWGVLCDVPWDCPEQLGHVVTDVVESLASDMQGDLAAISRAAQKYRELKDEESVEPQWPTERESDVDSAALGRNRDVVLAAQRALREREYPTLNKTLQRVVSIPNEQPASNFPKDILRRLSRCQRLLMGAVRILKVPDTDLRPVLEEHIPTLLSDPACEERIFKSIQNSDVKSALSACRFLREAQEIGPDDNPRVRAQTLLDSICADVNTDLRSLCDIADATFKKRAADRALQERDYETASAQWRDKMVLLRKQHHEALAGATYSQWNLGPRFLFEFEKRCRRAKVDARSLPWDPPRMVGWKLCVSGVRITLADLNEFAENVLANGDTQVSNAADTIIDGSYFTDYVHYVAMSRSGHSPWYVTRKMVAYFLRVSDLRPLLPRPDCQGSREELAGRLLAHWGWQEKEELPRTALASTVRLGKDGKAVLPESTTPNDLRIILESFCKDVLDAIAAQLGYSDQQMVGVIKERLPQYRFTSRTKTWREEVHNTTMAPAEILIAGLGTLAFPRKEEPIRKLSEALRTLRPFLNSKSHHNHDENRRECNPAESVTMILESARSLLGEMPWHMKPEHSYGDQPRVITGQAWSHGSPTPRLLRVVMWSGEARCREMIVWNRTGRNPVIADPVFLRTA